MGKGLEIPSEVQDTMRSLYDSGTKVPAIAKIVQTKYQLPVSASRVYYICHPRKTHKRIAGRKQTAKEETEASIFKDISSLIGEMRQAYMERLRAIRAELLRTVKELRQEKKNRGE